MALVSFMKNKVTFCNIFLIFPHNREGAEELSEQRSGGEQLSIINYQLSVIIYQ